MSDVVVSEFMDDASVARLSDAAATTYDPTLGSDRERLAAAVGSARGLIVRNRTVVDAALLSAGPRLRVVGRLGVGLDNIDLAACAAAGVEVRPATGANASAVAEHVIGAFLVLARPALARATEPILAGAWPRTEYVGAELGGRRLGLVGLGHTAREVARRASALGMDVAGYDPFVQAPGIPSLSLTDLFARSDAVSIHVPLTPETAGLVGSDLLGTLPRGAWLVDTSRGGVSDPAAIAAALRSGHLGGAALDVFTDEPPSEDVLATLRDAPNLVLTPHVAGVTHESNLRVGTMVVDAVLEVLGS